MIVPSGEIILILKTGTDEITYKLNAMNISLQAMRKDIYPYRTREGIAFRPAAEEEVSTMTLTAEISNGEVVITPLDKTQPTISHRLLEVL